MLRVEIQGGDRVARQLDLLRLTPNKRRTVLRTLGRMVRANSRDRVKSQTTLSGGGMQRRSEKSKAKGAMLKGLGKRMLVITDSADTARVTWRGGRVAAMHQHGSREKLTADDMRKREGEGKLSRSDPATRRQGKRLLELGYKVRKGKGWKRPTLRWITSNMTMGQAGSIVRILSNETPKESWDVALPSRPFLGVTAAENRELQNTIADAILKAGL